MSSYIFNKHLSARSAVMDREVDRSLFPLDISLDRCAWDMSTIAPTVSLTLLIHDDEKRKDEEEGALLCPPGTDSSGGGTGRKGSKQGWKRWNRGEHTDGSSDDFLHTHRHKWSPTHPPLPYGPGPAGNTHTLLTSHTPWLGLQLNQKWFVFIGLLHWQVGYHSDGSTCQWAVENPSLTMPNASN